MGALAAVAKALAHKTKALAMAVDLHRNSDVIKMSSQELIRSVWREMGMDFVCFTALHNEHNPIGFS